MNAYSPLYEILDSHHIKHASDVKHLIPEIAAGGAREITSRKYGWIKEFVIEARKCFESERKRIIGFGNPMLCFPYEHYREGITEFLDLRGKYSCYIPDISIHQGGSIRLVEENDQDHVYHVNFDYIFQLLHLKPLVQNGLAIVIPYRYREYYEDSGDEATIISPYFIWKESEIITVETKFPKQASNFLKDTKSNAEFFPSGLAMPILDGINLERYVEIVMTNRDVFGKASSKFRNGFNKSADETYISNWIQDYAESLLEIEIVYRTEMEKLKRKGIETSIGLTLTAISMLAPGLPEPLRTVLATVGSTKTVSDGLQWIGDFRSLKDSNKRETGWLLWRSTR